MKYQVVNQAVEINGVTRRVGEIVDETEFKPAEAVEVIEESRKAVEKVEEKQVDQVQAEDTTAPIAELDSLLKTGHVVAVEE